MKRLVVVSNQIDSAGFSGCFRCYHVWKPRNPEVRRCPRCKSTLWDVPRLTKVRRGGGLGIPEVLSTKREAVLEVLARHKAGHPRVFGSVARGTATSESDVDLLVEFEPGASALDQVSLVEELGALLLRRVDVASPDGLHWIVRPQVLFEAEPL